MKKLPTKIKQLPISIIPLQMGGNYETLRTDEAVYLLKDKLNEIIDYLKSKEIKEL